jgi:hypothetical protein
MSSIDHRAVMGAVAKGIGDERGLKFRNDPSKETAKAISDVVYNNLMALVKGGGKKKKSKSNGEDEDSGAKKKKKKKKK